MIELKNISKTYHINGREMQALKNVSLTVNKGDCYGVVGESGAGKSTLIRCVNALEKPTSGEVWLQNQRLDDLNESELLIQRRKIGMIFQHFNLLANRTVYQNIALPLELAGNKNIKKRVLELLELTNLSDKEKFYPAQLSGGQKQRVAIARALANEPDILLSDEATSALDPKNTEDILQLLKRINQQLGLTILLITHEMEVVKSICNKVALLEHGQLIESASIEKFFIQPQTELAKRFVKQAQHFDLPETYQSRLQNQGEHPVVKLLFSSESVTQPLLSTLTKRFGVDINIIQAKIEHIGNSNLGLLHAEIIGTEALAALQYLQDLPVQFEILGYLNGEK